MSQLDFLLDIVIWNIGSSCYLTKVPFSRGIAKIAGRTWQCNCGFSDDSNRRKNLWQFFRHKAQVDKKS